jgi:hypothetical protein
MASRLMRALVGGAVAVGAMATLAAPASAVNFGDQGCTPGYWKNHTERWDAPDDFGDNEPFTPTMELHVAFMRGGTSAFQGVTNPLVFEYADDTMLQALNYNGGGGADGAARILLRAATAAWLNAAHEGVAYSLRRDDIFPRLRSALVSNNRQKMLELAAELDAANNGPGGCPLN